MEPIVISNVGKFAVGIGFGLCAVGGGIGVGLIFSSALVAIARQPEQASKITPLMFIGAALAEGLALICAVFCLIFAFQA